MLLIASLLATLIGSSAMVAAQEEIPRNETLQLSGYEGPQTALRPWDISGQAGMAFFFMYEPLFCVNVAKGNAPEDLIKILGESVQWIDPLTVEVKIRPQAEWTDGQPITSDDVEYSYGVYGLAPEKTWGAQLALPFYDRLDHFEKVDDKTFRWHLKSAYPNSVVAWRHITESYQILPKHIWEEIEAQYGADMRTFANDWQAADMPDEWKVASGMYLPTYRDDDKVIMTRNENWWGKDVFGKLPAPKYILHTRYYYSNEAAALDFDNDEIDICGNFIAGIGEIMTRKPNVTAYDPNPPYYAEMSIKLLVPNHRNYPLNEPWLHKAIAMTLNYSAISEVSSGYLKAPSPYPSHLLPSDDAVAKELVRPEIEQQYAITNDVNGAIAILQEHCIQDAHGTWYTKDGPSSEYLARYGDDAFEVTDALPSEPGINVPLGPWTIMDQQGWSDVLAIDALACNQLKAINITMTQKVVDWGTNEADGRSFHYDFMHFVMHFATGTMYDRYQQMFVGTDYYWNHYGDYRNPEFIELLDRLDITTGSEQQDVADDILTIMGEDMPLIPFGGHPNWYQVNRVYWVGFSNKNDNPILPAGPFGGSGYSGLLQTAVLALSPNTGAGPGIGLENTWLWIAIIVVVIVVVVVLWVALARRKK
jgi:peptide/nickel transport system substrate-binding protein